MADREPVTITKTAVVDTSAALARGNIQSSAALARGDVQGIDLPINQQAFDRPSGFRVGAVAPMRSNLAHTGRSFIVADSTASTARCREG